MRPPVWLGVAVSGGMGKGRIKYKTSFAEMHAHARTASFYFALCVCMSGATRPSLAGWPCLCLGALFSPSAAARTALGAAQNVSGNGHAHKKERAGGWGWGGGGS